MHRFNRHDERIAAAETLPELSSMPLGDFIDWLGQNEEMYLYFRRFAKEAIRAGRERFSAYMIRERVRWYTTIETQGEYKVSNNITPYIARLLIMDIPQLEGVFQIKRQYEDRGLPRLTLREKAEKRYREELYS